MAQDEGTGGEGTREGRVADVDASCVKGDDSDEETLEMECPLDYFSVLHDGLEARFEDVPPWLPSVLHRWYRFA